MRQSPPGKGLGALLLTLLLAAGAGAQTHPFHFEVDSFSVPERGIFDDFDDGSLDPAWNSTFGSHAEAGTTLRLFDPGVPGFLPPFDTDTSVVSGQGIGANFSGDFTATSRWVQTVPIFSTGLNMAFSSQDFLTGNSHQLSIGVSYTPPGVASLLGGDAGLSIGMLEIVRDSPPGNILSISRSSLPIDASDIVGDILLSLIFDDTANTLTPMVSLDGGATTLTPFAPVPWDFTGGGFSLTGSSTVPEPGTALLLGVGLAGLAARPRRGLRPTRGSAHGPRCRCGGHG